jgi:hypothetical protein
MAVTVGSRFSQANVPAVCQSVWYSTGCFAICSLAVFHVIVLQQLPVNCKRFACLLLQRQSMAGLTRGRARASQSEKEGAWCGPHLVDSSKWVKGSWSQETLTRSGPGASWKGLGRYGLTCVSAAAVASMGDAPMLSNLSGTRLDASPSASSTLLSCNSVHVNQKVCMPSPPKAKHGWTDKRGGGTCLAFSKRGGMVWATPCTWLERGEGSWSQESQ